MKKFFLVASSLFLASIAMSAGGQSQQGARPAATTPAAPTSTAAPKPTAYREMLNKYCITCHNVKARIPAGAPLTLDTANLDDPGASAEIWEKVVRKIGVGAMPPQGSPSPGTEELNRFRGTLVTSLDAAAAKKSNPGRYVLHRLNPEARTWSECIRKLAPKLFGSHSERRICRP